jgi:hypothetical protein
MLMPSRPARSGRSVGDVVGHPPLSAHAARMRPALRMCEAVEPRRLSRSRVLMEWAHADQPPVVINGLDRVSV